MLRLARDGGPLANLTLDAIKQIGQALKFFPGIPDVFTMLEKEVKEKFGDHGIRLEEYVITGGLADVIAASPLGAILDDIWGCNFAYDESGRMAGIKNVVSFTEKTRFLFNIEKGLVGRAFHNKPYEVNRPMESEERPIPLRNVIYMGDGPSDIPCMSIVQKGKGWVIGVLHKQQPYRTWALGYGRRSNCMVPPDFREGEHGHVQLREAVLRTAERIKSEVEIYRRYGGPTPTY